MAQVLVIQYANSTYEVLPILDRRKVASDLGDAQEKYEVFVYPGSPSLQGGEVILNAIKLTEHRMPGSAEPAVLEGRTAAGYFFLARNFRRP